MNRRTRESFYLLWTAAILICLAVCVFALVYFSVADGGPAADVPVPTTPPEGQSAEGQSVEGQPAEGQSPEGQPAEGQSPEGQPIQDAAQPTPEPAAPSTVLGETPDMGEAYQNRLVFLGDSTTYGFAAYGVLPFTQVWTPASGTLSLFNWPAESINYYAPDSPDTPVSLSIADTARTRQPEYLVITLGLNGVAMLDEDGFKDYYRRLIQTIQEASPSTKIICQSIYPVIDDRTPGGIKNDRINAANGWILDLAEETGTRYLNTHDYLMDDTGSLPVQYDGGNDGIHLTPDGLRAILQYVRTHAWQ